MKLLSLLLVVSFTSLAQAEFSPDAFAGQFKVGDCNVFDNAKTATVTVEAGAIKILVESENDGYNFTAFLTSDAAKDIGMDVQVLTETHTLTNLYFYDFTSGPVLKVKLARSATGDRLRYTETNLERNLTQSCVLYRVK